MRRYEHTSEADLAEAMAISVAHALEIAIGVRGWAVLAVSGGRSPVPMFERLRHRTIRWEAVTITLVDERVVPPDHDDSNGALVRRHLLREAAGKAAFVPLVADVAEVADPASAVARLNAAWRQPDVIVLGMGEDGHTASLFPEAPELQQVQAERALHLRDGERPGVIGQLDAIAGHRVRQADGRVARPGTTGRQTAEVMLHGGLERGEIGHLERRHRADALRRGLQREAHIGAADIAQQAWKVLHGIKPRRHRCRAGAGSAPG